MDEIENLILLGAVEVAGIDSKTGEFLYNFTDNLKEIMPDLHREHMNSVNREIMYFWQKGFLEIDDVTSDNPIVKLTSLAFNNEEIDKLQPEMKESLVQIIRVLTKGRGIL